MSPTLLSYQTSPGAAMDPDELLRRCRDAARMAVRAPYSPDDRAECVADMYTDVCLMAAAEMPRRPGRPADVLRYIDRCLSSSVAATAATMPRRNDRRVTFTALRNRAEDWRRSRDAARDRDALKSGGAAQKTEHRDEPEDYAQYLVIGAAQSADVAHRAALTIMRELETADYGAYLLLYQWARHIDGKTAADELGFTHDAYRAATSRAARRIRESHSAGRLMAILAGSPRYRTTEVLFSLRDDSRDAHGRTPALAIDPRDGTVAGADARTLGTWPTRPLDATQAREVCRVTRRKAAPVSAARRRDAARNGRTEEEVLSAARAALGATMGRPAMHAGTHAHRVDVGRTLGTPPAKYAPRSVRLGPKS